MSKQVEIWDTAAVKTFLDDAVVEEMCQIQHRKQDFTFSNINIVIGIIACSFAILSWTYPIPFPDNREMLIVCCAIYAFCVNVVPFVVSFFEKDAFLYLKEEKVSSKKKLAPLSFTSKIERYGDKFTLTITNLSTTKSSSFEKSIALYFDKHGNFAQPIFVEHLKQALSKINA